MTILKERIHNKLMYLEKEEPYLYAALKRRMKEPIEFITEQAMMCYDEEIDNKAVVETAVDIALHLFKQMVAGDVYKK